MNLLNRIEAGEPGRELFEEAWATLHSEPIWTTVLRGGEDHSRPYKFLRMLTAEAWTSAAEMLVPSDCDWLINARGNFAQVWERKGAGDGSWQCDHASHPSLALLAAILRAKGLNDE